ncbi:MAG TPA: ATP-binding protein [Chloroflexota bacterium]|nr:ATP-binding protein [Chloroflexota bacterium]
MPFPGRSLLAGYAVAVLLCAVALVPWLVFRSRLEPSPFPLFLVAVVIASRYYGAGPGMLTTLAGAVTVAWFVHGHGPGESATAILQVALFVLLASFVIRLNVLSRRTQRALEASEAQLRQLVLQKDAFLMTAAHDLKSPLTTVRGLAQLLQRRAARLDPVMAEKVEPGLGQIASLTARMALAIDDLMDGSAIELGRPLELRRTPVDLIRLAESVAARYDHGTSEPAIHVDCVDTELIGSWDGSRMERVVDNLVSNAIKYGPHHGDIEVRVYQETRDGRGWAVLEVIDRGMGIPPDDLPYVFERFRRGGNAGEVPGFGVGLAGARQIVEQHGGTIEASSQLGRGSTFTVRLPLDRDGPERELIDAAEGTITSRRP